MDLELSEKEQKLLDRDDRVHDRTGYWLLGIATPIVISIVILGLQSVHWLRTGEWIAISISDAWSMAKLSPIQIDWVGLRRILEYAVSLPLAALLVFISIAMTFVFTQNSDKPEDEELRSARMKRARREAGWKS